jgi:hypothetical protein
MISIILVFHSVAGVQGNVQMKNEHLVITTATVMNFGAGKPNTYSTLGLTRHTSSASDVSDANPLDV